jgi:hypothetical protein
MTLRPALLWLMATAAAAAPPRVVNTFPLAFADGGGQIEWLSPSTFRFARNWTGPERIDAPFAPKPLAISVEESAEAYRFKSRYLTVEVEKTGGRITVAAGHGEMLLDGRLRRGALEQRAAPAERFYGLGARAAERFDLRGLAVETRDAFLLSSAGFGEFYPARGSYRFDLAAARPDTVTVEMPAERVDFFFYYGPTPKEIFEEHFAVAGPVDRFGEADFKVRESRGTAGEGSWDALSAAIRTLLHASLSAQLIPEFDLAPYAKVGADLASAAAQFACLMPVLRAPAGGAAFNEMLRWRARLGPYLLSYTKEARDRGIPIIRPLEIDSPDDAAARGRAGEFKLGDELLAVPAVKPGEARTVYLPRGVWTDLATGETYRGRQEIQVRARAGAIPLFARDGTIVPLGAEAGDIIELHYFPSLPAEFFLFEEDSDDISQFHAAPAGDLMRLEIESRAGRVYDWVIHGAAPFRKIDGGGAQYTAVADAAQLAPGRWYADPARKLLRIRVRAAPGGDEVLHLRP